MARHRAAAREAQQQLLTDQRQAEGMPAARGKHAAVLGGPAAEPPAPRDTP